jgi:hypothetical protein
VLFRSRGVPLLWNGSSLAVVTVELAVETHPEDTDAHVRFFEATAEGTIIGSDWNYPITTDNTNTENVSLDLVWTGEGYGLFYTTPITASVPYTSNLWLLSLDETGKPIGDPVMLADGLQSIKTVDADLTDRGFVVAWTERYDNTGWSTCQSHYDTLSLYVRLIAFDGTSDDFPEPVLISDRVVEEPSIATGEDDFGIVMVESGTESDRTCNTRFVRLSSDLTSATTSGVLANSRVSDVAFDGEEYVVATGHFDSDGWWAPGEICVARYSTSGMLSSPPTCNGNFTNHNVTFEEVSLAVGDDGLSVLFSSVYGIDAGGEEAWPRVLYLRTDLAGRQISSPVELDRAELINGIAIVWTGDGFSSLHSRSDRSQTTDAMVFNRFTREE